MAELVQKGFLNSCMNFGTLPITEAQKILKRLCEAHGERMTDGLTTFHAYVKNLNKIIQTDEFALEIIKHPLNRTDEFVVFYSTQTYENPVKQQSFKGVSVFFGKILDALMEAEEHTIPMAVPSTIANTMTSAKLNKKHVEELMKSWTDKGYFMEIGEKLTLGPRMLVEFKGYLGREYPDTVQNCPLCRKLVLWDVVCSKCDTRMHRECIRKYLISKTTCPSCKNLWDVSLK